MSFAGEYTLSYVRTSREWLEESEYPSADGMTIVEMNGANLRRIIIMKTTALKYGPAKIKMRLLNNCL